MIAIQKQLAVFLDNRPGTLARICRALAKDGINIVCLSISDTVDHAIVRMVLSDPKKAGALLKTLCGTVQERDVICMDMPNKTGALATLAEQLASAGINIEYAYCTGSEESGNMVLRTNDLEATIDALS